MPAAADVKLGDLLAELIQKVNALATGLNGALAKLDADNAVTDSDYVTDHGVSSSDIKGLEDRY